MQRTASDLVELARRAGLELVSTELVPSANGGTTLAARWRFDDPWAAARLLTEMTEEDAADPYVRAWALAILRASAAEVPGSPPPHMTPELAAMTARAIHRSVQESIRFVYEPRETFQSARETIGLGAGDCDDHARLVHALARAAGLRARLTFFEKDGQPVHVTDRIGTVAGPAWAETTIAAKFGEHPIRAYKRLRASGGVYREELG